MARPSSTTVASLSGLYLRCKSRRMLRSDSSCLELAKIRRATRVRTSFVLACAWMGQGVGMPTVVSSHEVRTSSVKVEKVFDLPTPGTPVAIAWSTDGSALGAASAFGGVLTVWDRDGRVISQIKRPGEGPVLGRSLAFVRGSSQLVFPPPAPADDSVALAVWNVATGNVVTTVPGPQPGGAIQLNRAEYFATTPDEELLAAATRAVRNFEKNLIVYDTSTWQVLQSTKIDTGVGALCVFAHGRLVAAGSISSAIVSVIDARTGTRVNQFSAYPQSEYGSFPLGALAGSPDAALIMVGIGPVMLSGAARSSPRQSEWADSIEPVRMLRIKDGSQLAAFRDATAPIRQAAWDPQGRYVAFVDDAKHLFFWAPWAAPEYTKVDLPSPGFALAIAPDGSRLAVSLDRTVRVYSMH